MAERRRIVMYLLIALVALAGAIVSAAKAPRCAPEARPATGLQALFSGCRP